LIHLISNSFKIDLADPESINVGTLVDPGDPSAHNYIEPTSDFHDGKDKNPKFGIMKKLTSGASVGPVDEGKTIRLVCRAGRARPVPQITWWQHNRGQIDDDDFGNELKFSTRKCQILYPRRRLEEY